MYAKRPKNEVVDGILMAIVEMSVCLCGLVYPVDYSLAISTVSQGEW